MARTVKKGYDDKGNLVFDGTTRPYYSRERKWARKSTNRKNRNVTKETLRTITDFEEVVVVDPPSTGGWITH